MFLRIPCTPSIFPHTLSPPFLFPSAGLQSILLRYWLSVQLLQFRLPGQAVVVLETRALQRMLLKVSGQSTRPDD